MNVLLLRNGLPVWWVLFLTTKLVYLLDILLSILELKNSSFWLHVNIFLGLYARLTLFNYSRILSFVDFLNSPKGSSSFILINNFENKLLFVFLTFLIICQFIFGLIFLFLKPYLIFFYHYIYFLILKFLMDPRDLRSVFDFYKN